MLFYLVRYGHNPVEMFGHLKMNGIRVYAVVVVLNAKVNNLIQYDSRERPNEILSYDETKETIL